MSYEYEITAEGLIEENQSCLSDEEPSRYTNINYGMRFVLEHLARHYEDHTDIRIASDHLAKMIAQIESVY